MANEMDYGYTYSGTTELGKFAAVKVETAVNPKDGFLATAAQNDPVLGIVQRGIVPEGGSVYNAGKYSGITGTAWPSNVLPASPQGVKASVRRFGRSQAIAAGAIARGDRLIAAATAGEVASVVTLALVAGVLINTLGVAETAAVAAGDVVYVFVNPLIDHV